MELFDVYAKYWLPGRTGDIAQLDQKYAIRVKLSELPISICTGMCPEILYNDDNE